MPALSKGQLVRVRRAGSSDEWCKAIVSLVSGDRGIVSAGLSLEHGVRTTDGGIILRALLLFVDYDAGKVEGLEGTEYEIEVNGS